MPGLVTTEDTATQKLDVSAFGETITTMNTPVIQFDFPHITPPRTFLFGALSGTAARQASTGTMKVSTGTTAHSIAVFRSERALVYRPGQGNMARFTAKFTTGVADSIQSAGIFTTTDGFTFSYNGTEFGILHRHGGELEIRELQVTSGAGGSENATVTVNGIGYTVPLTSGSVDHNAQEIAESMNAQDSQATYSAIDDTVTYVSAVALPLPSSFTFSSSSAAATWSTITAGVTPTNDYIAQSEWNINSGIPIDPTMFNVYQIEFQYLGAGNIIYRVEDPETGHFEPVHIIKYAGMNTEPSLRNPNLFLAIVADSNGSTTDLSVETASMAAFHQGMEVITGNARSHRSAAKSISTTLTNLVTVKVRNEVGGRGSHGELVLQKVSAATESTKITSIEVLVGATLGGSPNFQYVDETNSLALYDESGTTVTGGRLVDSMTLGGINSGTLDLEKLNEILLANETVTIAAVLSGSPASDVEATLTWIENI